MCEITKENDSLQRQTENKDEDSQKIQCNKNIPELRFPEFEGEWENNKIDYFFKISVAGDLKKEELSKFKINEFKYPVYGNALEKKGLLGYYENYKYEENNITVTARGNLGVALLRKKPFNAVGRLIILIPKTELNSYYVTQYINSKFKIYVESTGVPQLTAPSFRLNKIKIPKLNEQNKIANFLSAIDKKIELMEKKYALYCSIRKYFIENLFSNYAKSPNLRFNEFEDKWIKYPLKQLLKEIKIKSKFNNEYPLLSSTVNGIYLQKDYFNRNVGSKSNEGYKILSLNQIVLSPQNLWMGNINVNEKYDKGIVSPSYKIYDVTKLIRSDFIKYILKTPRLLYEYKISSEQGASIVRRNLNQQLFKEIEITIPSINEQEKIANFMLRWDMKIIGIKNQIQNIRKFKKGLLQKMFC